MTRSSLRTSYRSCDSVSLQVIIHVIIPPKPAFHIVYWHKVFYTLRGFLFDE